MMVFSDLLEGVKQEWHGAFVRFIETGEASDDFLDYVDSDQTCERMLEIAIGRRVQSVERYYAVLELSTVEQARTAIARSIEHALMLPALERREVLRGVVSDLERSVHVSGTGALCAAFQQLGAAEEKAASQAGTRARAAGRV